MIHTIKTFIILILLLISGFLKAQVIQEWVSTYNGQGNGNDEAYSVATDNAGNCFVTGRSFFTGSDYDYATVKYNSSGNTEWVRTYNGTGNAIDQASSIAVDKSGNICVTGKSAGTGSIYDFATIKYNTNGDVIWLRIFNGAGNRNDIANAIKVDDAGNIYVTGSSANGSNLDYATIKYNPDGVVQFVSVYNGTGNGDDIPNSIAVDQSGNVYVNGISLGNGSGNDYATVKYNSNGIQEWVQRYNGAANLDDEGTAISVDKFGSVYASGASTGNGTAKDFATIKYSSVGENLWSIRFNGTGNGDDVVYSMKNDSSGNLIVTGSGFFSGTGYDFVTIKYNSGGDLVWLKKYNGPDNSRDASNSIAINGAGEVFVTGLSASNGNTDYATIKYDTSGNEKWVKRYSGIFNGNDAAFSIALDQANNVYVTGLSYGGNQTNYDYATIKYSQIPTELQNISTSIPSGFKLYQNYPNPYNPSTLIKFDISKSGKVKLTVRDISGKVVNELVNKVISAGTYQYEFNAGNLSSGIYFYRLETPEYSSSKKMAVIK